MGAAGENLRQLASAGLTGWDDLTNSRTAADRLQSHGDLPRWREALAQLPELEPDRVALDQPAVTLDGPIIIHHHYQSSSVIITMTITFLIVITI
ncbi:MAG: hypothetical protein AAGA23_22890, partial [Pseudomonadota bacterium]